MKYERYRLRQVSGKQGKRWKCVLEYRVENPEFVERPAEGADTRAARQKRRIVWKSIAKTFGAEVRTKTQANAAAIAWQAEMEAEANAPKHDASVTLGDYIEQFVAMREAAGAIEASTARDYRHSAKRLSGTLADAQLSELTADEVQAWEIAELRRGISATVVGKVHRLLVSVCKWAVRRKDIAESPMDNVEAPKRPKTKPNSLTQPQMQFVTATLTQMEPTPLVVGAFLGLHAALRASECCGLRWRCVDFEAKRIRIEQSVGVGDGGSYLKTPKTDSSLRDVPIDDALANMLRKRHERMAKELAECGAVPMGLEFGELYVLGDVSGKFMNPTVLSRQWKALADGFGLVGTQGRRIVFHDLRHSGITAAVEAGADIANIAALAGHSNVAVTLNVYASATEAGKRRTAQAMGDYMSSPNAPKGEAVEHDFAKTGTDA